MNGWKLRINTFAWLKQLNKKQKPCFFFNPFWAISSWQCCGRQSISNLCNVHLILVWATKPIKERFCISHWGRWINTHLFKTRLCHIESYMKSRQSSYVCFLLWSVCFLWGRELGRKCLSIPAILRLKGFVPPPSLKFYCVKCIHKYTLINFLETCHQAFHQYLKHTSFQPTLSTFDNKKLKP